MTKKEKLVEIMDKFYWRNCNEALADAILSAGLMTKEEWLEMVEIDKKLLGKMLDEALNNDYDLLDFIATHLKELVRFK